MINLPVAALLLSLSLPVPLAAQSARYTISGTPCTTGRLTGNLGAVPLSVQGLPRLGSWFEIVTEGSARYPWGNTRSVHVLTGVSNTSIGGLPLPFDIALLAPGSPFCGLLSTSCEVVTRVPVADYQASVPVRFDVPNSTALLGLQLYQQVLSIESSTFGPPFSSMALSVVGHAVIGL